jgi:RHH-type proline utilization regulon transcriptional repressor/proline dehydrogenase/delta 1-pyrroline-5-carboxylate dehydrogenase
MKHLEEEAVKLASDWLEKSNSYITKHDLKISQKMNKLFTNKQDKNSLIAIVDRAFRSKNTAEVAKNIARIFKTEGIPSFFSPLERLGAMLFITFHPLLHFIMVPLIRTYIFKTSSDYVLFGSDEILNKRIQANLGKNLLTNVNRVGELLLGELDAKRRIGRYILDLQNPNITCISIKISTIFSQISAISTEDSIKNIVKAVSQVYSAAKENPYVDRNGNKRYKLVNFDMEEYRDLNITVESFVQALDQPEFSDLQAGIALQAYLPDSFLALEKITSWAKKRISEGKSPVRIRVVKGANMDMEVFETNERGWNLAPFNGKHLTDANYKKMLSFALQPENIKAVHIGVASHNLFDIAFIYSLAQERGVLNLVQFEMLSGMSPSVSYFLANIVTLNVLLYLPFSEKADFVSSIGYLVRRLDENTSPDNYLRYIHGLANNTSETAIIWKNLQEKFTKSINTEIESSNPNRTHLKKETAEFSNEPDTDFSLEWNRKELEKIKVKYSNFMEVQVPAVIDGKDIFSNPAPIFNSEDDSRTKKIAHFHNSSVEDVEIALKSAKIWNETYAKRKEILLKAIKNIQEKRFDLIGIIALNTGKPASEADPEISEAIDFGKFYLHSYEKLKNELNSFVEMKEKGTCLVVSPWNFPFAIPAGGIFASLVAGNGCIFKPSNFSIFIGYELAKCLWEAGVPKDVLQFIPTETNGVAATLTKSPLINFIVFTGGTETALSILKNNPSANLAAETGGKNFTIVTKNADRDGAIKNIIHSSFSNAGQKCSATSIVALESEVFNDEKFLATLKDAVESMQVGYGLDETTRIPQLIRPPLTDLNWALTSLEEGEKWLLQPKPLNERKTMWTAGIKILSEKNRMGRTHLTEFFGPILAIIEISSLEDGISLCNATGYGLTSGLESLSEEEQVKWRDEIIAGNLYINRSTTGAVVLRQPFGGMGKSAFGSGIKAGGYNYITQFLKFENSDAFSLERAKESYSEWFENYFSQENDYVKILGQQNITRFLKLENFAIRCETESDLQETKLAIFASQLCCKNFYLSVSSEGIAQKLNAPAIVEETADFVSKIHNFSRVKLISKNDSAILTEAAKTGVFIIRAKATGVGRIDLLNYLKEQSISYNYHRYGLIDDTKKLPEVSKK